MSTKEVARWDEELAKQARTFEKKEEKPLSNISLAGGFMKMNDVLVPNNKLPCIILGYAFINEWYSGPYDPSDAKQPDCYAIKLDGKGMAPPDTLETRVSPDCDTCPKMKWEPNPAKPGKVYKQCKEKRKLIVMAASAVKEGDVETAALATINIPVMSVANWSKYVAECAAEHSRPPWAVLTEISVVPNPRSLFEVKFKGLGTVADDYLGKINARLSKADEILLTPFSTAAGTTAEEEPKADSKKRKF